MGIKNVERKVEKLEKHEQAISSPRVISTLADFVVWIAKGMPDRENVIISPWLLEPFQKENAEKKKQRGGKASRGGGVMTLTNLAVSAALRSSTTSCWLVTNTPK